MFSLDLSLELINMVIIAAGVLLLLLLNMAAPLAPGPLSILMERTWCCVNALCV